MKNETHDFYCTQCGKKVLPIFRTGRVREKGHLKKLWCFNCNKENNCVEISNSYTIEMFNYEFEHHNFTEEGNRIYKVETIIKHMMEEN